MLDCIQLENRPSPLELHRDLTLPLDATTLWRYVDFAQFIDLLERQALWFPRTDQFEDPLEETYTDAERGICAPLTAITPHLGCACRIAFLGVRNTCERPPM